jgi:hypothetical protein
MSYNGWSNYYTWNASMFADDLIESDRDSMRNFSTSEIEDYLKDSFDELVGCEFDELSSFARSFVNDDEINWREIAKSIAEDFENDRIDSINHFFNQGVYVSREHEWEAYLDFFDTFERSDIYIEEDNDFIFYAEYERYENDDETVEDDADYVQRLREAVSEIANNFGFDILVTGNTLSFKRIGE